MRSPRTFASPCETVRLAGFSLVELLVVVSILAILMGLLLPAVQRSREAARRTQCAANLKQVGLALLEREEQRGALPSGGWGWKWPPVAERGDSDRQPGCWVYCVLPFLEQSALFSPAITNEARLTTVLPMFYCPSRRAAELYPCVNEEILEPRPPLVAKSDYAGNVGDQIEPNAGGPTCDFVQPSTLSEGDDEGWWIAQGTQRTATGVIFQRSSVRLAEITDGTTNTYLVGEKYLDAAHYEDGQGLGDLESIYHGDDDDTLRVAHIDHGPPRQDERDFASRTLFGSAHPGSCQFVMVDGSVHSIDYEIDAEVHRRLSNRSDGAGALMAGR